MRLGLDALDLHLRGILRRVLLRLGLEFLHLDLELHLLHLALRVRLHRIGVNDLLGFLDRLLKGLILLVLLGHLLLEFGWNLGRVLPLRPLNLRRNRAS